MDQKMMQKYVILCATILLCPTTNASSQKIVHNISPSARITSSSTLAWHQHNFNDTNVKDENKDYNPDSCDCCWSSQNQQNPWLQAELPQPVIVDTITIIGRTDNNKNNNPRNLKGVTVIIDGVPVSSNRMTYNSTANLIIIHPENFTALQEINVTRPGDGGEWYLIICEIVISRLECLPGSFIVRDISMCEQCGHCKTSHCNNETGNCPGECEAGWSGTKCNTSCGDGYFGDCTQACHCKDGSPCYKTNGSCLNGCDLGWEGQSCSKPCRDGYFGDCTHACHCKHGSPCYKTNGSCQNGCDFGWEGQSCSKPCRDGYFGDCTHACHCKDGSPCYITNGSCQNGCDFGWEGHNCSKNLNLVSRLNDVKTSQSSIFLTFDSSKAVDGIERYDVDYCKCCSVTNNITGSSWWQIDLGNKYLLSALRVYGRNDTGQNDNQLEYANIYAGNETMINMNITKEAIYKIPRIVSTTVFTKQFDRATIAQFFIVKLEYKHLTICQFELFEKVCGLGRFGTGCSHFCHCLDNKGCNSVTGECQTPGCYPGWRGKSCDQECAPRSFGKKCEKTCHCINQTNCDNVNGTCEEGECDPGWQGLSCNTECEPRSFGEHCGNTCHCVNQTNCHHINGTCEEAECDPGWQGLSCDTECNIGRFGPKCDLHCHCVNKTACDNVNGTCEIRECDPGWTGDTCDTGIVKKTEYVKVSAF